MTTPEPITRRSALLALAAASLTGCDWFADATAPDPTPPGPRPPELESTPNWVSEARLRLKRGIDWLVKAQAPDGRWRSDVYGFFKEGQSLTPFVLDALLDAADAVDVPSDSVARGLQGVLGLADAKGRLGFRGPAPDYPVYATSLALRCLGRLRPAGWEAAAAPLTTWLRSQQFTGRGGWRDHPALGGFPMGWTMPPKPPNSGHVDLSMTRRALEGLRAAGVEPGDPVFRLGFRFVMRSRGVDGGFLYSPVEPELNKGVPSGQAGQSSYGTATCDGLLALRALSPGDIGADVDGRPKAVTLALTRLEAMHRVDVNPGVIGGPMEPFATAMRGYYRAASARVFATFEAGPEGWQEAMATAVGAEQADQGSWRNESNLQKEDDPTVATAFAVRTLSACLR